ncbi:MAG TPA: ferrochelatase [Mycobacteriales bacterium]|nr:ferrochelatase [Mycobacteriales bacterium]
MTGGTAIGRVGVLAMAYGTPRDRDDIAAYYTDIRRGHPPTDEQLAALVARYDALGGTFPLREITERQVDALQAGLGARAPEQFTVVLGTKHSQPSIAEGVAALAADGIDRAVGVVLAPHWSTVSVGQYAARAAAAGEQHGVAVETIPSWHLLPAYVDFLAGAVTDALAELPGAEVLFTAHSVPARVVEMGDPYPQQLRETAEAVAAQLDLPTWSIGWQSAGRTADPWLGPDVLEVVRDRAAAGSPGLVVCACGFTADHLEVAYDLDIEAARLARQLSLPFGRTRSVNADAAVLDGLAGLVFEAARLP